MSQTKKDDLFDELIVCLQLIEKTACNTKHTDDNSTIAVIAMLSRVLLGRIYREGFATTPIKKNNWEIVKRMANSIVTHTREKEACTDRDFIADGFTKSEIEIHGPEATGLASITMNNAEAWREST